MSALPPKADIGTQPRNVRFVPKADILRCGKERRYSITSSARENTERRGEAGRHSGRAADQIRAYRQPEERQDAFDGGKSLKCEAHLYRSREVEPHISPSAMLGQAREPT